MNKNEVTAEIGLGFGGNGSRMHIPNEVNFKNDEIKEIFITKNELVAVITFSSGQVSLYDCKNGFSLISEVVDEELTRLNTNYNDSEDLFDIKAKVIETSSLVNEPQTTFKDNSDL
jgi:hypothetical protein